MKQTARPLVLTGLLSVVLISACSDVDSLAGPEGSSDPLVQKIVDMGFRRDMIQDFGSYYLVEGDITFEKESLRGQGSTQSRPLVPGAPTHQYHTSALVSSANVYNIKVDLSALSSHSEWASATTQAMGHWSGISDSYIRMEQGSPADITVSTECRNDGILARASYPGNGKPGSVVVVNLCWMPGDVLRTPTDLARLEVMVHELGHTIGFRHTNWVQVDCDMPGLDTNCTSDPSSAGANHVPGTPTSGGDGASVMNGGQAGEEWNGFSSYDLYSAKYLYPLPGTNPGITYVSTHPYLSWTALQGASYYTAVYVVERQTDDYETGTSVETDEFTVGTTSGTWYHDTTRSYTGVSTCIYSSGWQHTVEDHYYEVWAHFPNGVSKGARVWAEVAVC